MEKFTERLADFVVKSSYENTPKEVIHHAKNLILDLLGVTLGASSTPEAQIVGELIRELGGKSESTIIGFREKTSCTNAAFMNSIMSHTLELDDTHVASITHAGCVVIPSALSIAEHSNCDGRKFLLSVIVGYECMLRIALSIQPSHWERGFHTAGTCGSFGAAAAAAKILGLDRDSVVRALGLAGTQASGLLECIFASGDMSKRLNPGRAAANGVVSALLAEKGFTGPETILEGKFGFCRAVSNRYDLQRIIKDLGSVYEVTQVGLKPYACCRYYHSAIDAIFEMMKETEINPMYIKNIEVKTHEKAVIERPHRYKPLSVCDAQMSLPYSVAVALLEGRVTINEFKDEKIKDPRVHEIARKVKVKSDPELTAIFPEKWSNDVTIVMNDGRSFRRRIDIAKGEPENPMTKEEVSNKFSVLAAPVVGNSKAQEIIRTVYKLEQVDSIKELTELLHG